MISSDKDFLRFFKRCDHLTGALPGKFPSSEITDQPRIIRKHEQQIIKDHQRSRKNRPPYQRNMGSRQPAGEDLTSAEMLNLRYMTIIIHDNPWFVNMISIEPHLFEESTLLGLRADSNEHSAGMSLPSASTPSTLKLTQMLNPWPISNRPFPISNRTLH